MAKVGEIRAKFVVDAKEWEAGINKIEAGITGVGVKVEAGLSEVQGELRKTSAAVKKAGDEAQAEAEKFRFERQINAGVAAFTQISQSLEGFRAEMSRAGGDADDLRDRLAATFGDLADQNATLAEQQLVLGFDPDQIADALVTLKKLGADGEAELKRLEDAARFTNQPVTDLADALGRFEKFGDAKSIKAYQKAIGASAADLEKYGAKLKDANTLLVDNEDNLRLAAQALRDYEQANFAGAAERQADATTRLQGNLELLKREVGGAAVAFTETFAPALNSAVEGLRGLPDGIKAAIGVGVELVGVGATVGASVLQLGANVAIMVQGMGGLVGVKATLAAAAGKLQGAFLALNGTLGLTLGVIGAAGLAVAAYTSYLNAQTQAQEAQIQKTEEALKLYREQRDTIIAAADAVRQYGEATDQAVDQVVASLRRLGKDDVDVTDAILANGQAIVELQNQARKFRSLGRFDDAKAVEQEIAKLEEREEVLRKARVSFRGQRAEEEAAEAQKSASQKAEQQRAEQLLATYKEKSKAGVFDDSAQQLAALDKTLAAIGKQHEAYNELALTRVSLARRAADEESKVAEGKRKEGLAERLNDIQIEAAAGRISKAQEIAQLKQVLDQFKLVGQERRQIELQIANLQGQIRAEDIRKHEQAEREKSNRTEKEAADRATRAAKAEAEAKRKAEAEAAQRRADDNQLQQLAKTTVEANKKVLDSQVRELEGKIGKESVLPQLEALLKKREQLEIAQIQSERDALIAATQNEQIKVAAAEAAEAKIRTVREETTQQLRAEVDKQNQALQSHADKHKAVVAQISEQQNPITSRVGGKNSPLFSDPSQGLGINLGNFELGNLELKAQPKPEPVKVVPAPTAPTATPPFVPPSAPELGKQMAQSLREAPLQITVQAIVDGAPQQPQTFSGTAADLAAGSNIYNPGHILGRP